MRFSLYMAGYALLAALTLAAAAPTGLNLCIQSTGKATIGLSCACVDCASRVTEGVSRAGLNCCQHCSDQPVLKSRCCTCTKLPAMTSAVKAGLDLRLKCNAVPALRPVPCFAGAGSTIGYSRIDVARRAHGPPRAGCTVLRL